MRLTKRKNRYNLDYDHEFDWKNYPGEKVNRIWEWWRAMIFDWRNLTYYKEALTLISLVQIYSCAVERVF